MEAVLSPNGKIEHAQGDACERENLRALAYATIAREAARGELRHEQPQQAVAAWRGRVAARWTLIDRFERDGKRYVLARANEPAVTSASDLSSREQQVVASAALGRTNKEIAYDLGLAESTVRVLVARAAKKLGASNRSEAIRAFVTAH
jgi:DNA-binding NarL/FixJ family response regulator